MYFVDPEQAFICRYRNILISNPVSLKSPDPKEGLPWPT